MQQLEGRLNLVGVVSSVEVWEDADIGLASHFAVCLDLLLCNFRIHCGIILDGACSQSISCQHMKSYEATKWHPTDSIGCVCMTGM